MHFPNKAGDHQDTDDILKKELEMAGINVYPEDGKEDPFLKGVLRGSSGEVKTSIRGNLHYWSFERAWNYWIAKGPGIDVDTAEKLHQKFGKEVRVDGHAAAPSPREHFKGLACGHYHIDTQTGLKALADTIKSLVEKSSKDIS